MKKIALFSALIGYLVLAPGLAAHAAEGKDVKLSVTNVTQNADATASTAKVGDVISFTAEVKNTSQSDLKDYIMSVAAGDFLKVSKITDLGGSHVEGTNLVFPPILQAAGCNCSNNNTFKMKIVECPAGGQLNVSYEGITKTVTVNCATPTPVPVQTQTPSGPSANLAIIGSVLAAGMLMWRRKMVEV